MEADIVAAENDRRRQIAYSQQQQQGNHRTSLSEINNLCKPVCPSFAKRPDFRRLALKNLKHKYTEPVFKVSVAEIYESTTVRPVSFDPNAGPRKSSRYGKLPASRKSAHLRDISSSRYRKQHNERRRESNVNFQNNCEKEILNNNYYYNNMKHYENYY
jgi:hypothetical protein